MPLFLCLPIPGHSLWWKSCIRWEKIYIQDKYWSVPLISRNFFYLLIKSVNSPNVFPPYFSREVLVRPKTCWSSFSKKIENLLSHSPSRFWDCCLIKRGVQLLLLPGINCFVLDSELGLKKAWSKEVPLVPAFLMTATDRISKILFK